ncbi:MAG: hypothetical protein K2R98_25795 [Gemmataceae bacterium]|nr:hypothetical protein [Gemmataceae bacterium]
MFLPEGLPALVPLLRRERLQGPIRTQGRAGVDFRELDQVVRGEGGGRQLRQQGEIENKQVLASNANEQIAAALAEFEAIGEEGRHDSWRREQPGRRQGEDQAFATGDYPMVMRFFERIKRRKTVFIQEAELPSLTLR